MRYTPCTVLLDYTYLAVYKHYQQTAMPHRLISGWWRSVFVGVLAQINSPEGQANGRSTTHLVAC